MKYFISQGMLLPPLEVEIEGVPLCLFCGKPVSSPSMGGPLVCGACDCGKNPGGSRWTPEEAKARYAHRRARVAEYKAQQGRGLVEAPLVGTGQTVDASTQGVVTQASASVSAASVTDGVAKLPPEFS